MTKTKTQRNWLSPLNIPEGEIGDYAIKHLLIPAGQKVMLNNFRNQLYGRQKGPHSLIYDVETRWHKLIGPTGTWMTDLPVEQRQMEECLKGVNGRVLVGGLGLGLAASILAKKRTIKEVLVVELSQEVMELVWPHTNKGRWDKRRNRWTSECIVKDLLAFLLEFDEEPFDYAFYDIWQSDSETTFFDVVLPLLQLSKNKVKHPPICWNETVMRGQLFSSIQTRLLFLKPEVKDQFPEQVELTNKYPL